MKKNTAIDDSFLSNDILDLYVTFERDEAENIDHCHSTSDKINVSGMSKDSEDHIDWNILNENEESEFLWKEIQALSAEEEERCYIFDNATQTFTSIKDYHTCNQLLQKSYSPKDHQPPFNHNPDSLTDDIGSSGGTTRKVTNKNVKLVSPTNPDNENILKFTPLSSDALASLNEPNSAIFPSKGDFSSPYYARPLDYCQQWINQLNEKQHANQTPLTYANEKCDQYQMLPQTSKRDSNLRELLNKTDHRIRRTAGEPRRPKNGFIRFSIDCRQQVAKEKPRLDNREISRVLGAKWRKMTAEERKPYEVEFEKDISEIRELNPEWRYAPAKKFAADLVEPMPSRLRPREKLKRNIPPLVRPYKRRKAKKAPQSEQIETTKPDSSTWVQCDLCSKWRRLPKNTDIQKLPPYWYCQQNPDKNYDMCLVPEELQLGIETDPSEISNNRENCLNNADSKKSYPDLKLNSVKCEIGAMCDVLFI